MIMNCIDLEHCDKKYEERLVKNKNTFSKDLDELRNICSAQNYVNMSMAMSGTPTCLTSVYFSEMRDSNY